MANQLFPVFDVPEVSTPAAASERKYKPSVYFDYDLGDFRRDSSGNMVEASGHDAYIQWCLKTCMTERFTRLAYSADIGTELIDALDQDTREAVESAVERTITEALMVNPRTEYVRAFTFTWEAAELRCTFIVKGREWEERQLSLNYTQ